jgi:hypothetical protein
MMNVRDIVNQSIVSAEQMVGVFDDAIYRPVGVILTQPGTGIKVSLAPSSMTRRRGGLASASGGNLGAAMRTNPTADQGYVLQVRGLAEGETVLGNAAVGMLGGIVQLKGGDTFVVAGSLVGRVSTTVVLTVSGMIERDGAFWLCEVKP